MVPWIPAPPAGAHIVVKLVNVRPVTAEGNALAGVKNIFFHELAV